MAENFITFPTTDLDVDNLPTTLTNAVLSTTTSISGLTNDTAYRTFVLSNPSGSFTPAAVVAGITRLAVRSAVSDTTNNSISYSGSALTASTGSNRMAILIIANSTQNPSFLNWSATWGAQAFTQIGPTPDVDFPRANVWVGIIKEADIPAGSNAITITPDVATATGCNAVLLEYSGVDQVTSFASTASRQTTNNTSVFEQITIAQADSMMLSASSWRSNSSAPISLSAGITEVLEFSAGENVGIIGEQLVGATGLYTHTHTNASAVGDFARIWAAEMLAV